MAGVGPDGGGKDKDATIANMVGAVVVSGIAWNVCKSLGRGKKEEERLIAELVVAEQPRPTIIEEKVEEFPSIDRRTKAEQTSEPPWHMKSLCGFIKDKVKWTNANWNWIHDLTKRETKATFTKVEVSVDALETTNES